MAISAGDWASATDPFLWAADVAYTSTTTDFANDRIILNGATGIINGVTDKDVSEVFWSSDNNKESIFRSGVVHVEPAAEDYPYDEQYGPFSYDKGSGRRTYNVEPLLFGSAGPASVFFPGESSGVNTHSLFIYSALAWAYKDPAQILFSWIVHHTTNPAVTTLKDYLDQTSFQAASDYYDDNPCQLSLWREKGRTIAQQIKTVFDHVGDFVSIKPSDADGTIKMNIHLRRALTERTTAIDITSRSVSDYTIRPTDRHTLDTLSHKFGAVTSHVRIGHPPDVDDWITGVPLNDLPNASSNTSLQLLSDVNGLRRIEMDLPYYSIREELLSHLDISMWAFDQDEVEIQFADWTHLNFEVGDVVHLTGGGYDGTENLIVAEKTVNLDDMMASVRLLRVYAVDGKNPRHADVANLLFSVTANSLGYYLDGTKATNTDVGLDDAPRNFDRWWHESDLPANSAAYATEFDRGTGGPAGGNPDVPYLNLLGAQIRNRWPTLYFDGLRESGLRADNVSTTVAKNYTFYWVGNPGGSFSQSQYLFHVDGIDDIVFAISGAGTPGRVQFYDGTWRGTIVSITGWQILTFVLDSTGAKIRRNGADIETGLAYTQREIFLASTVGVGFGALGNASGFYGNYAEAHLFQGAHSSATIDDIEAHLAEKYGITI